MGKLVSDSNRGDVMKNLSTAVCTNYVGFSNARENYGCCSLDLI